MHRRAHRYSDFVLQKVVLRIDKCSQSKIVEDYGQIVEDRTSCEIEGEIWGSSM